MGTVAQTLTVRSRTSTLLRDYAELFKARVTALIVVTAACGSYFAAAQSGDRWISPAMLASLLGIGMVAAGTAGFNEIMERELDARMRRTSLRPLVTGRMSVWQAAMASGTMLLVGALYLAFACNWFTALLTLLTSALYLGAYTPMKTVGPSCTAIGAISGAMPPVLGWVAIRGRLDWEAFVLFSIMFFWQFPHFDSIALLYREDYERAGIRMLPVIDHQGKATPREIVTYSFVLIPVSMLPTLAGMAGWFYCVAAVMLGIAFSWYGLRIWLMRDQRQAKQLARGLLRASVLYLPALFALMMIDSIS